MGYLYKKLICHTAGPLKLTKNVEKQKWRPVVAYKTKVIASLIQTYIINLILMKHVYYFNLHWEWCSDSPTGVT